MAGYGPSRNPRPPAVAAAFWGSAVADRLAPWAGAAVVEPPDFGRFFLCSLICDNVLYHIFGRNPMARRSVPPPKPRSPILTVGQKRRRIERLQKCVTSVEAFDFQKARKRAPAVLELEAAIDKALSSAFGYGTPAYLRYNQAATLEPSPLITNLVPVQQLCLVAVHR